MNVRIVASTYQGWSSVVLESELVRVELIPQLGAKIVSLSYKPTGKEWLLDAGERELKLKQADGLSFGQLDMSGWDECFPTIDACSIELEDAVVVSLPDHGEVWSLSWEASLGADSVCCSVNGAALPYELSRTISFADEGIVRMDYRVVNLGEQSMPFLWVPHPQFAVEEPTQLELPTSTEDALCVFGELHHQTGERYRWDELSLISAAVSGDGHKYYAPSKREEGWCRLLALGSGNWLRLEVDPQQVPYFGVWIDEGMFNDRNVITPEPSIGYYDSLARAVENGSAPFIAPGDAYEWSMKLQPGEMEPGHLNK
ncbi:hypothetical protein H8B09_00670 [Paenibacillus sp. PR3]|uniref:Galactose mutarotase n=1 Tax=Paenibacillus terricola TaxID=2763503 RepID=A0ABR8MR04_9BACL|nr:hypothetical protein [Paenibacillus terricola]MBD3917250.1 hypothetical protein [Paenibacillus terricola]